MVPGTVLNVGSRSPNLILTAVQEEGTQEMREKRWVSNTGASGSQGQHPALNSALGRESLYILFLTAPYCLPTAVQKYLINKRPSVRTPEQYAQEVPTESRANCGALPFPSYLPHLGSASLAPHPAFSFTPYFCPTLPYLDHKLSSSILGTA